MTPMLPAAPGDVIDVVPQRLDPTPPTSMAGAFDVAPEPPRDITRERLEGRLPAS